MTPGGALTTLHAFDYDDGAIPVATSFRPATEISTLNQSRREPWLLLRSAVVDGVQNYWLGQPDTLSKLEPAVHLMRLWPSH